MSLLLKNRVFHHEYQLHVMIAYEWASSPQVIKLISCSIKLSKKFKLLTKKLTYRQIKKFLALSLSDVVFIMLINVKMPTARISYSNELGT